MNTPTNYYIYYRVAAADGERLESAVAGMQASLQTATGIRGQLLRRRDDPETWMEVYEGVLDSTQFESALSEAAAHHKLEALLESPRVIERFVLPTSTKEPAA